MIAPRLLLCSGITASDLTYNSNGREVIELNGLGADANVNIRLEDVARIFLRHLSPRLVDLIEIASYVYAADCGTQRGKQWSDDMATEPWGRDFHFVVPVRDLAFWERIVLEGTPEDVKRVKAMYDGGRVQVKVAFALPGVREDSDFRAGE